MPQTHRQSDNLRWLMGVLAGLVTLVVVTVVLFYLMSFTVGRLLIALGWLHQQQPPGQNPPVMYFVIRFVQIIVMVGVSGYAGYWVHKGAYTTWSLGNPSPLLPWILVSKVIGTTHLPEC